MAQQWPRPSHESLSKQALKYVRRIASEHRRWLGTALAQYWPRFRPDLFSQIRKLNQNIALVSYLRTNDSEHHEFGLDQADKHQHNGLQKASSVLKTNG
jgi:hypothetical protein